MSFLVLDPFGTSDQILFILMEMGPPLEREEGLVFLCRRYILNSVRFKYIAAGPRQLKYPLGICRDVHTWNLLPNFRRHVTTITTIPSLESYHYVGYCPQHRLFFPPWRCVASPEINTLVSLSLFFGRGVQPDPQDYVFRCLLVTGCHANRVPLQFWERTTETSGCWRHILALEMTN
jgi:hypothetical protein